MLCSHFRFYCFIDKYERGKPVLRHRQDASIYRCNGIAWWPALPFCLVLIASCGDRKVLHPTVEAPLLNARVSNYTGWFPGPWHQEIFIRLQEGTSISDVADLRVFESLRPGMSLNEAIDARGEPSQRSRPLEKLSWGIWRNDFGASKVTCVKSCSGSECFTSWRLHAYPEPKIPAQLFVSQIVEVIRQAEELYPDVKYRAIHIREYAASSSLGLVIESDWEEYMYWAPWGEDCDST